MFKVTFSDGRKIDVAADNEERARTAAYRIERAYTIVSVDSF